MTNLEELREAELNLRQALDNAPSIFDNASLLNVLYSTYLSSIAKSLAIIADKMSEEKKED